MSSDVSPLTKGVSEIHGKPGLRRVTPAAKTWPDDLAPTDEDLKRIEFLAVIPDDILPIYDKIWTRLLS